MVDEELLFEARARVLRDLEARHCANRWAVSALEEAVSARAWWVEQWPAGGEYIAGLIAQDVQDALSATLGRWPLCVHCGGPEHSLYISPDLGGPDPVWVCEESGTVVAALGALPAPPEAAAGA